MQVLPASENLSSVTFTAGSLKVTLKESTAAAEGETVPALSTMPPADEGATESERRQGNQHPGEKPNSSQAAREQHGYAP